MSSRIPPLLEPYMALPSESSLIILTSVLGASTNWLVQRYLYSFLHSRRVPDSAGAHGTQPSNADTQEHNVVFVSFLRNYTFWRDGVARLGLDLDALSKQGRLAFIDGLGLFSPTTSDHLNLPYQALSQPTVEALHMELEKAIAAVSQQGTSTILIIDQVDLLLAATEGIVAGNTLQEMLLGIRNKVHSSILSVSADEPLLSPRTTPLEKDHAAFVMSLAHAAVMVVSLRMLDTGTAKDISGVMRISNGGVNLGSRWDERELLYFIASDGTAKVFERGQ